MGASHRSAIRMSSVDVHALSLSGMDSIPRSMPRGFYAEKSHNLLSMRRKLLHELSLSPVGEILSVLLWIFIIIVALLAASAVRR